VELLLVLRAHLLEQLAGGARLVLVDLRDGEADVDQDPVARSHAVEQPDVDGAPHPGHLDPGEPVGLVDDLHDPAGNGQAHPGRPPLVDASGVVPPPHPIPEDYGRRSGAARMEP
jgi:hypothetical protein